MWVWIRKSYYHKWHLATKDNDIYGTMEAADCGATGYWLKCQPNMPPLPKEDVDDQLNHPLENICKHCER